MVFDKLGLRRFRYEDFGLAVNRLVPWYGSLAATLTVFIFIYLFFYGINGYIFLFFCISLGALVTLTSFSIINALLSLIFTYFLSAIVFFLAGLDFLGLMLIFVYVGAIAILFLFVVMTLSLQRITSLKFFNFFDIVCLIAYIIFILIFSVVALTSDFGFLIFDARFVVNTEYTADFFTLTEFLTNLGYSLYGEQLFLFILTTLILFLGFFCPIVLTLEEDAMSRLPPILVLSYPQNILKFKLIRGVVKFTLVIILGVLFLIAFNTPDG